MRPEHVRAIAEGEVAGLSRAEIAAKTELTPRTISRYRHRPEVLAEVERLRSRTPESRAVDILLRLSDSEDERIALDAAKEILKRQRVLALGLSS
jgi:hypothetical protein